MADRPPNRKRRHGRLARSTSRMVKRGLALGIVPTGRSVLLLILLAPVALVIAALAPGAWLVVPAAAGALLVLMMADGFVAGRLLDTRLTMPADSEIGQEARVFLLVEFDGLPRRSVPEAALACDPRLGHEGAPRFFLERSEAGEGAVFTGEIGLAPVRRGTAAVTDLWLRWRGPMGLADRQTHRRLEQTIRIWPDLSPVRSPQLQAFLRDWQTGQLARRVRGEGSQFEALAEYAPGMDRRRIDWKASARHLSLIARENEAERDNQIVLALDCGQAMCEPVDGLPRIDRAVSAALTAANVALKGGDTVALFGFAERPLVMSSFVTDARGFRTLQQTAAELDYTSQEPNFTLALATLTARLKRRSMIILFSELRDTSSAELMLESFERLARRHRVIFVTMTDPELDALVEAAPGTVSDIAVAVAADALRRARALVLGRMRRLGAEVIEAPHDAIGYRLIDTYLEARRRGRLG